MSKDVLRPYFDRASEIGATTNTDIVHTPSGVGLYYERHTLPGNRLEVAAIHPGLALSDMWVHQITPLLKNGFNVTTVDLPGFGRSPIPTAHYSSSDTVRFLLEEELDLFQYNLMAASFGAITALEIALNSMDPTQPRSWLKVRSFFLVSPSISIDQDSEYQKEAEDIYGMVRKVNEAGRLGSEAADSGRVDEADYWFTQASGIFLGSELVSYPCLLSPFVDSWFRDHHRTTFWRDPSYSHRKRYDFYKLAELRTPARIVIGTNDPEVFKSIARDYTACLRFGFRWTDQIEIVDAGHFSMIENPEAFNLAMVGFFTEVNRLSAFSVNDEVAYSDKLDRLLAWAHKNTLSLL